MLPYEYVYMTVCCSDNIEINCIICGHILLCCKKVKPNEKELSVGEGILSIMPSDYLFQWLLYDKFMLPAFILIYDLINILSALISIIFKKYYSMNGIFEQTQLFC